TDTSVLVDPIAPCTNSDLINCDADRTNLKAGKQFYAPAPGSVVFNPLFSAIDDAFRYKTRFQNRQGQSIGFAPDICVPDSNAIPYCYDPSGIEQLRARVDCVTSIYSASFGSQPQFALSAELQDRLRRYLTTSFSYVQQSTPQATLPVTYDGF